MRPAAKPDSGYRRCAAPGDFLHVIELEPAKLFAAVPGVAHERALPAVTRPDGAFHLGGNVPRTFALAAAARAICGREALALERLLQEHERSIEHGLEISRGDRVPQERLHTAQAIVRLFRDRELDREALGGSRRDPGARLRQYHLGARRWRHWPRGQ